MLRSLALSALTLVVSVGSVAAQGPPPYPVVFVHGIASHDAAWEPTFDRLESLGWGEPITYHADLNASASSTNWTDDVRVAPPVRTSRFGHGTTSTLEPGDTALRDEATSSTLFAVNFEAVFDGVAFRPHTQSRTGGQSSSNESAIAKQAAALSVVIADVRAWTGADRVILVAHSMGGLATREYLQRHRDGAPRWWSSEAGHGVAASVTFGTPHHGTRASVVLLQDVLGVTSLSEAMRDLRAEECFSGCVPGRFLWGSTRAAGTAGDSLWHNLDIDADGDPDGVGTEPVDGLNAGDSDSNVAVDAPAHPLPLDVSYVYIRSYLDGLTPFDRQALRTGDGALAPVGADVHSVISFSIHTAQTASATIVADAILLPFSAVSVEDRPAETSLRVWPNPASKSVSVSAQWATAGDGTVVVFDALGRRVREVALEATLAGPFQTTFDVSELVPGAYRVVLTVGAERQTAGLTVAR